MKFLRLKCAGKSLVILPKAGCSWCTDGVAPDPPAVICSACHRMFKKLLCSPKWNKGCRLAHLSEHPLCNDCLVELATVVDHIESWAKRPDLFWCSGNWGSMCIRCHNRKTAREDFGGFGHGPRKF